MQKPVSGLMKKLGYQFQQVALLEQALTHRSCKVSTMSGWNF